MTWANNDPHAMAAKEYGVVADSQGNKVTINVDKGKPSWKSVGGCCGDNALLMCTMAGVIIGVIAGFTLRNASIDLSEEMILCISYPGEIFMRTLKLIILPLVVSSIISCCSNLNAKLNGKIAVRTFSYFAVTSLMNACLGVTLALLMRPGEVAGITRVETSFTDGRAPTALDSFLDIGRNIFPDNFFEAFLKQARTTYIPQTVIQNNSIINSTEGEVLYKRVVTKSDGTNNIGIITWCLIFGTVLGMIDSAQSNVVSQFFNTMFHTVMKIMSGIMWLTPLGICSIIAGKVLSVDHIGVVVSQLGWFIMTVTAGVLLYQLVIMQLIYALFLRRNPFPFYWGLMPGMLTAFATASTAAALPVTFTCIDKQRVSPRISRYILPIGASINMDGTALFLAAAAVFIAQLNHVPLHAGAIFTLLLVATAGSMSSASVPSAALVLMLMVLSSINCPIEDVSLLFAVDWLVDRIRTTNNMLGDCYAAAVVEHLSGREICDLENHVATDSTEKSTFSSSQVS